MPFAAVLPLFFLGPCVLWGGGLCSGGSTLSLLLGRGAGGGPSRGSLCWSSISKHLLDSLGTIIHQASSSEHLEEQVCVFGLQSGHNLLGLCWDRLPQHHAHNTDDLLQVCHLGILVLNGPSIQLITRVKSRCKPGLLLDSAYDVMAVAEGRLDQVLLLELWLLNNWVLRVLEDFTCGLPIVSHCVLRYLLLFSNLQLLGQRSIQQGTVLLPTVLVAIGSPLYNWRKWNPIQS
mmetsp:Transcript_16140/g.42412  ORF Transcript_16140/g.42412 Transcript_16140/m.42412 type:complete len:233 (+) Transcript_16140:119-817(+)